MRSLFLFAMTIPAFAADDSAATALIEKVANAASKVATWRIEGSVSHTGDGKPVPVSFTLVAREPNQLHFEQLAGDMPAIIVCDGTNAWAYSPVLRMYRMYSKTLPTDGPDCSYSVGSWRKLATTLEKPMLSGKCGPNPEASSGGFDLIRGASTPDPPSKGKIKRTLCIDPSRNVVAWEQWKLHGAVRTSVYNSIDRDVELSPGVFQFHPPDGAELVDVELPIPRPYGTRGSPMDPGKTMPRLLRKIEPTYDEGARRAGIQGTVVLWTIIGVDGTASRIRVYRSLDPRLDAQAMTALAAWKFKPGEINGVPHAISATVEMNFKMR